MASVVISSLKMSDGNHIFSTGSFYLMKRFIFAIMRKEKSTNIVFKFGAHKTLKILKNYQKKVKRYSLICNFF